MHDRGALRAGTGHEARGKGWTGDTKAPHAYTETDFYRQFTLSMLEPGFGLD